MTSESFTLYNESIPVDESWVTYIDNKFHYSTVRKENLYLFNQLSIEEHVYVNELLELELVLPVSDRRPFATLCDIGKERLRVYREQRNKYNQYRNNQDLYFGLNDFQRKILDKLMLEEIRTKPPINRVSFIKLYTAVLYPTMKLLKKYL